jgi:hypothetical protein
VEIFRNYGYNNIRGRTSLNGTPAFHKKGLSVKKKITYVEDFSSKRRRSQEFAIGLKKG